MCYRPLRIVNNSSFIHESYCKPYLSVPCGHCYECRKVRTTAWQIRCAEELKNCKVCYFYTLTYDPQHITSYGTDYDDVPFITFNKSELQKFMKRLRKHLGGMSLKYMITSELGEETHRPHHHMLLYFYEPIDAKTVQEAIEKTWQQGFVKAGDNHGIVVNPNAVMYVVKYMHKTDKYYNGFANRLARKVLFKWYRALLTVNPDAKRPTNNKLHYELIENSSLTCEESLWNNFYNSAVRDYNQHCAFHLQSTNFGLPQNPDDYKGLECKIYDHNGGYKYTKTPLYYLRKFYYDRVPNLRDGSRTKYVLNSDGIELFADKFADRLQARQDDAVCALTLLRETPSTELMKDVKVTGQQILDFVKHNGMLWVKRMSALYQCIYKDLAEVKNSAIVPPHVWFDRPKQCFRLHAHYLRTNNYEMFDRMDFLLNLKDFTERTHNNRIEWYMFTQIDQLIYNYRYITGKQKADQAEKLLDQVRAAKNRLTHL